MHNRDPKKVKIAFVVFVLGIAYLTYSFSVNHLNNDYPEEDYEPILNEDTIPDEYFYEDIESAMLHARFKTSKDDSYKKVVDEVIASVENDKYITVFFKSIKDEKHQTFTIAKFRKKQIDGNTMYCFLSASRNEIDKSTMGKKAECYRSVEKALMFKNDLQNENIDPENTTFLWGVTTEDKVYKLKINGQTPSMIKQFYMFDQKRYYWIYEDIDLESQEIVDVTFE